MSSLTSRTFPTIEDLPPGQKMMMKEHVKKVVNIPFYDCPDDFDFLCLLENETWPQLEERFDWLKLKFRILNAKSFNRFFNNIMFSDVKYYPGLLSWHFDDCINVNFLSMKLKNSNKRFYNNNDSNDDDYVKESSCQCALGLKAPDEKIKRNASGVSDLWCMDGSILNISRMKNEYFGMYRSKINDWAVRYRYFGYSFNGGDESQFSEEMRRWSCSRLTLVRNYVAFRLRLVNYIKTVKKYNLPMDFYGLKITNGKWHVKSCLNTEEKNCECGLAFDHPKGWLRYFCNINNIGDEGYAFFERPIFRDFNYKY